MMKKKFKISPNEILNRIQNGYKSILPRPNIKFDLNSYEGVNVKIIFTDEELGDWTATPNRVVRGSNHPKKKGKRHTRNPKDVEAQIQINRPHVSLKYNTFINMSTKATFIDDKYGEWTATPDRIVRGSNHPKKKGKRHTPKDVEAQIQINRPYISLKYDTFINMSTKATFIDDKYGEWDAYPNHIIKSSNHPKRYVDSLKRTSESLDLQITQSRPHISLKCNTLINMTTKATFIDDKYGEWDALPCNVVRGSNHPLRNDNSRNPKDVEAQIQINRPYVSLKYDTFINMSTKATFIDDKYGEWDATPANMARGSDHPSRSCVSSNLERVISEAIHCDKNFTKLRLGSSTIIPDFIISKVLIECDGLYWHSEKHKDKWHHFGRRELAELFGYKILQFRGNEINGKLPIVISVINASLNRCEILDFGECILKLVNSKESFRFFESNHLGGGIESNSIGLFNNNELIQAVSFIDNRDFVSVSFCSKINSLVHTGYSRLLIGLREKFNKPIISKIDLRYSSGEYLIKLGFKLRKTLLDWEWVDRNKTRYAKKLGWYKIYDAGQAEYVISRL